jgi:AIPR protein
LLEANVRSFLSATGKVNRGIRDTLRDAPEHFMAFNNGIVVVADEARFVKTADGGPGLAWLRGMQIVNGGQTTASIYFTKKRSPEIDLRRVRVSAKVLVLRDLDASAEEALISDISRYANSQNSVKLSDLSANRPFHVEMEKLSLSTYCPDGVTRWFYERAGGSYNVFIAREGSTPARLQRIRQALPPNKKVTKTDLAKYLHAWDRKPHLVSLGSQKNFERFMGALGEQEAEGTAVLPDAIGYRRMIAKAIIFRATQRLLRPMFQAFQANVIAYTVSVLADRIGDRFDLDKVWAQQDISANLRDQIKGWAEQVNEGLHASAAGRMVSEWAKKPECWDAIRSTRFKDALAGISELR